MTNRKYNMALSVLLGRHMDSVVVDTDKTARDCIQYLKEHRIFPMTFIPLQNLKASDNRAPPSGCPPVNVPLQLPRNCKLHVLCLVPLYPSVLNLFPRAAGFSVWVCGFCAFSRFPPSRQLLHNGNLRTQVSPVNERLRQMGGTVKMALDVLQCEKHVERAFVHVLE